jgi:hypothetical protein
VRTTSTSTWPTRSHRHCTTPRRLRRSHWSPDRCSGQRLAHHPPCRATVGAPSPRSDTVRWAAVPNRREFVNREDEVHPVQPEDGTSIQVRGDSHDRDPRRRTPPGRHRRVPRRAPRDLPDRSKRRSRVVCRLGRHRVGHRPRRRTRSCSASLAAAVGRERWTSDAAQIPSKVLGVVVPRVPSRGRASIGPRNVDLWRSGSGSQSSSAACR